MFKTVTTITPHRISFAGGGTDIPKFYEQYGGAVLSTTIDKYLYVTVKYHSPLFKEKFRLCYSETERTNYLDDIKNSIARECLKLVPINHPIYISTVSDIPSSTGLGSSSSFAVGLLHALHLLRGEKVSAGQLAEESSNVEINILNHPIGKQDQYAAAYGGLNYFKFQTNGSVKIEHILPPNNSVNILFDSLLLFWTGVQRKSEDVLKEQYKSINQKREALTNIKNLVKDCKNTLLKSPLEIKTFGNLLDEGWQRKRTLASTISNTKIDKYYQIAISNGAYGGKIAGAGGGGFLILVCDPDNKENLKRKLSELTPLEIGYEPRGSQKLYSLDS